MTLKNKNFSNIKTYFKNKIDVNKIVVSNIVSFGKKDFKHFIVFIFKYFISYFNISNAKKTKPLCKFFSQMSAYRRDFDEAKYISFLVKDSELLAKYNEIWGKNQQNYHKRI